MAAEISRLGKHFFIAIGLIIGAALGLLLLVPFGIDAISICLFAFFALYTLRIELTFQKIFHGYGVSKQLNRITGLPIAYTWEPRWKNLAIGCLVQHWQRSLVTSISVSTLLILVYLNFYTESLSILFAFISPVMGWVVGTVVGMYVWFAVNRYLQWYISEAQFRQRLFHLGVPDEHIEKLVLIARGERLLYRP